MSEQKPASPTPRKRPNSTNKSGFTRAVPQAMGARERSRKAGPQSSQQASARSNAQHARTSRQNKESFQTKGRSERVNSQRRNASHEGDFGKKNFSNNIWTKHSSRSKKDNSQSSISSSSILLFLKNLGLQVGHIILRGVLLIGSFLFSLFNKSTKTRIIGVVLILIIVGGIGDSLLNMGKVFPGVKVGIVDVGGKTPEEASSLLAQYYQPKVSSSDVVFFADENAKNNPEKSDSSSTIEEQISYEESLEHRTQWTTPASKVGAWFDADQNANSAFNVGRDTGGLLSRIQCLFFGYQLNPECSYDDNLLNSLRTEMSSSVGNLRVNFGVEIKDSLASVTDGHDGEEVNEEWLKDTLNKAFCGDESQVSSVLKVEKAPLQITRSMAQSTADTINNSIELGANFEYEGSTWEVGKDELSRLVTTEMQERNGSYELKPVFNSDSSKNAIISKASEQIQKEGLVVSFERDSNGDVRVKSNTEGKVPEVSAAINELNESFFVSAPRHEAPTVAIPSVDIPNELSFDDAIAYGLIGEISSYTTQFSSGAEARNHNIKLACSLLTNSIAKANGGSWSFNDTAGETTEELGYQNAGAIVDGEYTDEIGGGVCQVATTVYNAIYDAGYPITERHNHTLYIASYPEGRDAAIAYPYYDLVWENDSSSDVLLVMSATNSSVTATLYGVSPDYLVSTEYGEWKEGEKYTTKYKDTDELPAGTEKLQTSGTDGREITIVRTVKDSQGNVRTEQTFTSVYDPKDEVILRGTA